MTVEMVSDLIPIATEQLKLGIFNRVAVREVDINKEFEHPNTGDPVEVFTYYRSIRTSENKYVTQALHIFLKGNSEKIEAYAFVGSYPSNGVLAMGHRWSYISNIPSLYKLVFQVSISFEELPEFIADVINKAQEIVEIKPRKTVNKHFQKTVTYLRNLYIENPDLSMMSVHISSTTLSFSITCETGWGSDYHFNVPKDGKSVAL